MRRHLGDERSTLIGQNFQPCDAGQELSRCQDRIESDTGLEGFPHQVWALENGLVAFTASEPANILNLLILTTDDHGQRS